VRLPVVTFSATVIFGKQKSREKRMENLLRLVILFGAKLSIAEGLINFSFKNIHLHPYKIYIIFIFNILHLNSDNNYGWNTHILTMRICVRNYMGVSVYFV